MYTYGLMYKMEQSKLSSHTFVHTYKNVCVFLPNYVCIYLSDHKLAQLGLCASFFEKQCYKVYKST